VGADAVGWVELFARPNTTHSRGGITNANYIDRDRRALREIEGLMNAKRNTPEGERLDALVTLVSAWEAKHHTLDLGNSR